MPLSTLPVSYCAVGQVFSAFPMLSSVSAITSAVVHQYAGTVEAEINGKIAKRYALPLTVECPLLQMLATRETIYRTVVQRALINFPPAQQGQHPLYNQHKEDQELLKMISEGKIALVDSSGAVISNDISNMDIYSTTKDYVPTFHEGPWGTQVQDPDKIDDALQDRDIEPLGIGGNLL